MVIRECFNIFGGNSGLTESVIYWNPPKDEKRNITVYSGATLKSTLLGNIDKEARIGGRTLKIFTAPAVIVVRKGLAGKTQFIECGNFTINDDAYVIKVKEKFLNVIDIEWFEIVLHQYTDECISSRGTNGTFSKEQFLDLEFSYPSMQEQKKIVRVYRSMEQLKQKVWNCERQFEKLEQYIVCGTIVLQGDVQKFFELKGGNAGLTEEFIYNNQPVNGDEAVIVYSSSTDDMTNMGAVSKKAKLRGETIKCFKGPAVLIARNGQAGKAMYIEEKVFTINDHAYVLTVKSQYKNIINLEWFSNVIEKYTKNCVTSKDSNGTFSKEVFLRERIDVLDYEMQKKIVRQKKSIHTLYAKMKEFAKMLD